MEVCPPSYFDIGGADGDVGCVTNAVQRISTAHLPLKFQASHFTPRKPACKLTMLKRRKGPTSLSFCCWQTCACILRCYFSAICSIVVELSFSVFCISQAGAIPALLLQISESFDMPSSQQGMLGGVAYLSLGLGSPIVAFCKFRITFACHVLFNELCGSALEVQK